MHTDDTEFLNLIDQKKFKTAFQYVGEDVARFYEVFARNYNPKDAKSLNCGKSNTENYLRAAGVILHLANRLERHVSILDLGCGNGQIVQSLPEWSISKYTGIDTCEEYIMQARAINSIEEQFSFKYSTYFDYGPEVYDITMAISSLSIIPDNHNPYDYLNSLLHKYSQHTGHVIVLNGLKADIPTVEHYDLYTYWEYDQLLEVANQYGRAHIQRYYEYLYHLTIHA